MILRLERVRPAVSVLFGLVVLEAGCSRDAPPDPGAGTGGAFAETGGTHGERTGGTGDNGDGDGDGDGESTGGAGDGDGDGGLGDGDGDEGLGGAGDSQGGREGSGGAASGGDGAGGTGDSEIPVDPGMPVEVQVSAAEVVDFEFDWGRDGTHCPECNSGDGNDRLIFSDREHNVWLGYVNSETGAFEPSDGRAQLIDTRGAFATDFGNGPEWMFGKEGSQIVYTKYLPGEEETTLSASLALARRVDDEWSAGILPGGYRKQSPMGTLDLNDPAPRINYQDHRKEELFWRTADDPESEALLPIANQTGGGSRRWVPGTRSLIYTGGAKPDAKGDVYQQVFVYNTETDKRVQLTFEPVKKWGAFMWRAPEFDESFVFVTMYGRTKLAFYRKLENEQGEEEWTQFKLVEMPDQLPYIWSPEPFVYGGRSYVFFQLSSDPVASDFSVPTQIAITGIDPARASLRMLTNDRNVRRVRMDPEHFITEEGPYIYYNRYVPKTDERPVKNDGVWRIDTGLGPSSAP